MSGSAARTSAGRRLRAVHWRAPCSAARPSAWAPRADASGPALPRARKAPMNPASRSPLPPVARPGLPLATTWIGPRRSAITVGTPLRSTVAFTFCAALAAAAQRSFAASSASWSPNWARNSPRWGVSTMGRSAGPWNSVSASASRTVGTARRASTALRNCARAGSRPRPGPTTMASAHSTASAAAGSSSGPPPSADSTVRTSGRLARAAVIVSFPATSLTSPAPAARAAEGHRDLGANRPVSLAAREVEPGGPVDRGDGRAVGDEPLREGEDVAARGTRGAGAEQGVHGHGGRGPRLLAADLPHPVHAGERAVVDRVVGLGIEGGDPHGNAAGVQRARHHPAVTAVVARPGDDERAARQHLGRLAQQYLRDGAPRGLHQHAGRNAVLRARGRIPGGGFGRREDGNGIHVITTPP